MVLTRRSGPYWLKNQGQVTGFALEAAHIAHAAAAHLRRAVGFLGRFGGDQQAGDRGRILQGSADDLGGVAHASWAAARNWRSLGDVLGSCWKPWFGAQTLR